MSVRCPDCGAVASYGREIGHKSDCPSLQGNKAKVAPAPLTIKDQEVEVASRAIWDQYAGDCNSDCRWGQMCSCEVLAREWAVAAIEAIAKLKRERGKELSKGAITG